MSPSSAAAAHGGRHVHEQEHELAAQLRALKAAHEHERAQAAARMRSALHISARMLCSTVCLIDSTSLPASNSCDMPATRPGLLRLTWLLCPCCRELQAEVQAKAAECNMQLDVIAGMREEYRALARSSRTSSRS